MKFDAGATVNAMIGLPKIEGRFFYADDNEGFNFESRAGPIGTVLDTLLSLIEDTKPPAIALQALHAADVLPAFQADNWMALLDGDILPRIWNSNRSAISISDHSCERPEGRRSAVLTCAM